MQGGRWSEFFLFCRRHKWMIPEDYIKMEIYCDLLISGSSRPDLFCKKGVLRNFAKFIGTHLSQILFFNKVTGLRPSTLLKETLAQVFSCEFCEISKNTCSDRTPGGCFFNFLQLRFILFDHQISNLQNNENTKNSFNLVLSIFSRLANYKGPGTRTQSFNLYKTFSKNIAHALSPYLIVGQIL